MGIRRGADRGRAKSGPPTTTSSTSSAEGETGGHPDAETRTYGATEAAAASASATQNSDSGPAKRAAALTLTVSGVQSDLHHVSGRGWLCVLDVVVGSAVGPGVRAVASAATGGEKCRGRR